MGTDTTTEGTPVTIERFGDFNAAGITPDRHWLRLRNRPDGSVALMGPILTDRPESKGLLVNSESLLRIVRELPAEVTGSVGDATELERVFFGDQLPSAPTHTLLSLSFRALTREVWAEVVLLDTAEARQIADELRAVATSYWEGAVPPGFKAGESIVPAHFIPTLRAPDGKTKVLSRLDITPISLSPSPINGFAEKVRREDRRRAVPIEEAFATHTHDLSGALTASAPGALTTADVLAAEAEAEYAETRRAVNEELMLTVWIATDGTMHLRGVVLQEGVAAESGVVFSPEAVKVLAQTDLAAKPVYGGRTKRTEKASIQFERFVLSEPSGILTGYAKVLQTAEGRAFKELLLSMTGLGAIAPKDRPGNLSRLFAKFSFCVQSADGNPENPVGPAVSFEAIDVTFFDGVQHIGEKPRGEKLAESAVETTLEERLTADNARRAEGVFSPKHAMLRRHGGGNWTLTDLVTRGDAATVKGYRFAPGFAANAAAAANARGGLTGRMLRSDGSRGSEAEADFSVGAVWADGEDLYITLDVLSGFSGGRRVVAELRSSGVARRSWDSPPGTLFETGYRIELAFAEEPPAVIPADFPIAGLRVAKSAAAVRRVTIGGATSAMRAMGEAFATLSRGVAAAGEAMLTFPDLRQLAGITDAELATMRAERDADLADLDPRAEVSEAASAAVGGRSICEGIDREILASILRQPPRNNPCREIALPRGETASSILRRKPKLQALLLRLMPGRSWESMLAALEAMEGDLWLNGAVPADRPGLALDLAVQLSDLGLLDVICPSAAHRQLVALYAYVLGHGALFEHAEVVVRVTLAAPGEVFEGEGRLLHACWSPESMDDLRALHGVDAECEVIAGVGEQIALELQREVLNAGVEAMRARRGQIRWIASSASFADVMGAVLLSLGEIGRGVSRGDDERVWFVIGSPEAIARLGLSNKGEGAATVLGAYKGLGLEGTHGSDVFIWCDPFFAVDEILVGGIDGLGPAGLEYRIHRLIELETAPWDSSCTPTRRVRTRGTVTVNPEALRLLKLLPAPKPDAERHDAD